MHGSSSAPLQSPISKQADRPCAGAGASPSLSLGASCTSAAVSDPRQLWSPPPTRACAACRTAKVRCDRLLPCARCTRLQLECAPPVAVQRGRPSRLRLMQRNLEQQTSAGERGPLEPRSAVPHPARSHPGTPPTRRTIRRRRCPRPFQATWVWASGTWSPTTAATHTC